MKNHWTYYLPVSNIVSLKEGQEQILLEEKIFKLSNELDELKKQHTLKEYSLTQTVLSKHTWEQIDEAKAEAIITQRTPEEQERINDILKKSDKIK